MNDHACFLVCFICLGFFLTDIFLTQKYRLRLKGEERSLNSDLPRVSSSRHKANSSTSKGSTLETKSNYYNFSLCFSLVVDRYSQHFCL